MEEVKRGRGRPPGSKNKRVINRAPGSANGHAVQKGLRKGPKDITLEGVFNGIHPHDVLRLDPPDDSPIWALPLAPNVGMTAEHREKKMRLFLAAFAQTGIWGDACQAAGISKSSVEHWRKSYPQFEAAFSEAKQLASAVLEREALSRAVTGWQEPVYQGGELVGTILKKSDRILEVMLRARVDGYNPKLEMSGAVKSSSKVDDMPADAVESLLRVLAAAEERGLLAKPELTEGEFRDVEVDNEDNSDA